MHMTQNLHFGSVVASVFSIINITALDSINGGGKKKSWAAKVNNTNTELIQKCLTCSEKQEQGI